MSSLTISLGIGAALVIAAQFILAGWYVRRFGTVLRPKARSEFGRNIPTSQVVILVLFVAAIFVGYAAPAVSPGTPFSEWLREPFASVVYYAWCYAGMLILFVASGAYAARRRRERE
jgi:hypothetical protein